MIIRYIAFIVCGSILFVSASENIPETHIDEFGNTELHYAMRRGFTAHHAMRYEHMGVICTLLYAGISFKKTNNDGLTASEFATCYDTADGFILPLAKEEIELYDQGKVSILYGGWLKRNHSDGYDAWLKAYEKSKRKTVHIIVSPYRTESPPIPTHHKKIKSADSDTSYNTKRTASMPITSTTAPPHVPAIIVSYAS